MPTVKLHTEEVHILRDYDPVMSDSTYGMDQSMSNFVGRSLSKGDASSLDRHLRDTPVC